MHLRKARVATAAAGVALALALTACSNSATTGGSSSDPNTITLAATTNEQPAMTAAIDAFKKANPGVDVKATYSALDQYQTTTRTQLSSGTAPDVVFVWPGDGNPMAMKTVAGPTSSRICPARASPASCRTRSRRSPRSTARPTSHRSPSPASAPCTTKTRSRSSA